MNGISGTVAIWLVGIALSLIAASMAYDWLADWFDRRDDE